MTWSGQQKCKVPREINICIAVVTARDRYVVSRSFTSHGVSLKVLHDQQNAPFLGITEMSAHPSECCLARIQTQGPIAPRN